MKFWDHCISMSCLLIDLISTANADGYMVHLPNCLTITICNAVFYHCEVLSTHMVEPYTFCHGQKLTLNPAKLSHIANNH